MNPDTRKKQEMYQWIRMSGYISLIPIILVAGPLAGYFAGEFLVDRFHAPAFLEWALALIGFLSAVREVVRILRLVLKDEQKYG